MPTVVPVKFKYTARELWFNPSNVAPQEGDHVICETARGVEMGLVVRESFEVSDATLKEVIGENELNSVVRIATDEDYLRADELAVKSEEAFPIFRRLAQESGLDIKPVASEYIFGGDKIVCYFAAEERVDFRQLVRDLSHELHDRIDMRQIGVREEAALTGGFAHCGQELCCARLGAQFEPVSIRMAKEQDLPLNSAKISGACGRLMCCLRYEFEAYRDFKNRAPKRTTLIDTPLGKAKIVEYDTPKEQLCLRLENGKQMRIDLADMTCSSGAKKHDCEGGCHCRPDTVGRDVLDRLSSPEIQMALAELDRENGIEVDTDFNISDISIERHKPKPIIQEPVEPKGQKRRVRKTSETKVPEKKHGMMRKRRRHVEAPEAKQPKEMKQEPQKRPRRTKTRRPGDKGEIRKPETSAPKKPSGNKLRVRRVRRPKSQ